MKKMASLGPALAALLALAASLALLGVAGRAVHASPEAQPPSAIVKVWDTAAAIPPALSLGMTPGESVEDPTGLTRHGTSYPTVVTLYANSSHPGGRSGLAYWNPEGNLFAWYGLTAGFPAGVDVNRSGPVRQGGPDGTSFGPGDVWVAVQNTVPAVRGPVYVHVAGTNFFRFFGVFSGSRAWGVAVDQTSGDVFMAQPEEGRIVRLRENGENWIWGPGGSPAYVALDATGLPYTTLSDSDAILRIDHGADGNLGTIDDTATFWRVPNLNGIAPSFRSVPHVAAELGAPGDNANGIIKADADGNIWFAQTNSNEIGRLGGGPDRVLGNADDEICEYTTPGLLNPQQLTTTGSASALQVFFTEGDGNSVSVLTPAAAEQSGPPTRTCTTVPAEKLFGVLARTGVTEVFDVEVAPLLTAIVPTMHEVSGADGSASATPSAGQPIPPILRFAPMPNPLLSSDGTPLGDSGNGFPSGLTGVYAGLRLAGALLKGNKHFEVASATIAAPPPQALGGLPGRMTGGGKGDASDGRRVKHGFVLHCLPGERNEEDDDDDDDRDSLQVNWDDGNRFRLKNVSSASCSDDPMIEPTPVAGFDTHTGSGIGRFNDVDGATVEWTFTDAGTRGSDDSARILLRDRFGNVVLEVNGKLAKGNHKARKASSDGD